MLVRNSGILNIDALAYFGSAPSKKGGRIHPVRHRISEKRDNVEYSRRFFSVLWKCLSEEVDSDESAETPKDQDDEAQRPVHCFNNGVLSKIRDNSWSQKLETCL